MKKQKVERIIKESYKNIAPDIIESILQDCDKKKGQIIVMKEKKEKNLILKYALSMAAMFLLVFGGFTISKTYKTDQMIDSVITLDVNPSIEIQVNKNESVLGVTALNEDAKTVIGNMDFVGSKLDVTINALIGSMLRNGYINDTTNSILVSVDSDNQSNGKKIQTKLMDEINSILEDGNVEGAILGLTVTKDEDIQKLADQYGITIGKAKLIKQITTQNTYYNFEDLVALSINELNLISESGSTKLENIDSIGVASSGAYVGEKAAKDAAYAHAGVNEASVIKVKCELDWEKGEMIYEVDFNTADFEYEYEINAKNCNIIRSEKEKNDDYVLTYPTNDSNEKYISADQAKAKAMQHAGVSEGSTYDYFYEFDHEHGTAVYEIEFKADSYEYSYDIDASTGNVVKYEKEINDDVGYIFEKKTPSKKDNEFIGKDEAKAAAINHSGVNGNDIYDFSCKFDYEDRKPIYEIEFKANGYEYDYEVDAVDGTIIKFEKEHD